MGSKSRVASEIVPIIQSYIDNSGLNYLEPFCGGCNVIDKVVAPRMFASDNNKYLIALWKHLQNSDELPDAVTKELYADVRTNPAGYPDWYVGAVGFLASYNGRFFDGGYAGTKNTKGGVRDYYDEARRNVLKQRSEIRDIEFACSDYIDLKPSNMVVYCDPPYKGTKQYATSKGFDYEQFWETMREWSRNNIVLISEHEAPDDFEMIWERPVVRNIDYTKTVRATERLFKHTTII